MAYPAIDQKEEYGSNPRTVLDQSIKSGVLTYLRKFILNDERQTVGWQIEIAGYRNTRQVGTQIRLILEVQEQRRAESELREILERDPINGKLPLLFSFLPI
jgi:phosphoribosylformylglycinamidine (FGAM) synthase PurS component